MPEYRRAYIPGGTYFFTLVTYQRTPFLVSATARRLLRGAWVQVQARLPFTTDAICLLPDHLHCIWTLPETDRDYSLRWREIKRLFSTAFRPFHSHKPQSSSRLKRGEVPVWQRRFWEHAILDAVDWERHIDYIHYNPVKHGLVETPVEWPHSSFHRYVQAGWYEAGWGSPAPEDSSRFGGE